ASSQIPPSNPSHSHFFFPDPPTTEIYTLSLHDALPISSLAPTAMSALHAGKSVFVEKPAAISTRQLDELLTLSNHTGLPVRVGRSEEHTSELQSRGHLVCRLLLEKKKKSKYSIMQEQSP